MRKCEAVGPLHYNDGILGKYILETEGFEIVKISDAIQVHVIDAGASLIFVDQSERGAGDFVFARRAETADDSLCQRGLPCPKFARKQNQNRRLHSGADFAAALDRFFR